ncbi:MAG: hypothetical protein ACRED0_05430 [Gammaproteobacteria bacterium]
MPQHSRQFYGGLYLAQRTRSKWVIRYLVFACGLLDLTLLVILLFRPTFEISIDPSAIQQEVGKAYFIAIPMTVRLPYVVSSDGIERPYSSQLKLLENGQPLGPSDTAHQTIREIGGGAFSHWMGALWFSTSDGSDPRTNRKNYMAFVTAGISPWIIWGIAALNTLFIALFWYWLKVSIGAFWLRRITQVVDVAFFVAISFTVVLVNYEILNTSGMLPYFSPDSASYLDFNAVRGVFYPSIVLLTHRLFSDISYLIPIQLNFMILSFLALGWAAGQLFQARVWGYIVSLLLIGNSGLMRQAIGVVTEPFFVGFVCLHLASVFLLIRQFSVTLVIFAGVTAAAAILIRPAGYSLLLCLPLIVLLSARYRCMVGLSIAVSATAVLLLGAATNFAISGAFSTHTLGGLSLLGHAVHLLRPNMPSEHPELAERIHARVSPLVESTNKGFPHEYWISTSNQYNLLLWQHAVPEIKAQMKRQDPTIPKNATTLRDIMYAPGYTSRYLVSLANGLAMSLAISIIADQPIAYIRHVVAHLYGMWNNLLWRYGPVSDTIWENYQGSQRVTAAWTVGIRAVTDITKYSNPAIASELSGQAQEWHIVDAIWERLLVWRLYLNSAAFAFSLMGIALLPWITRMSAVLKGLCYSSFALWTYFGFVAAVQAGIPRYALVFEPVVTVILASGVAVLIHAVGWSASRFGKWVGPHMRAG